LAVEQSLVCLVLVGRAADLTAVEPALGQVIAGRGQTVLGAGEAGIEKSRSVAETKERAKRLRFAVLARRCVESDRSLPFGPSLDLVRGRLVGKTSAEVVADLGAAGPEVAKLLPELATPAPGLAPSAPLEPEQEKRRRFHTLARLLSDWATDRSRLVVIPPR
jgi:predicted ATPase